MYNLAIFGENYFVSREGLIPLLRVNFANCWYCLRNANGEIVTIGKNDKKAEDHLKSLGF